MRWIALLSIPIVIMALGLWAAVVQADDGDGDEYAPPVEQMVK